MRLRVVGRPSTDHLALQRMQEWGINEECGPVHVRVFDVLRELNADALALLKDPRLEVKMVPEMGLGVWAYFQAPKDTKYYEPQMHPWPWVRKTFKPRRGIKILLVLTVRDFEEESPKHLKGLLRDHLGHTLLYLRDPAARNTCADAMAEWNKSAF